MLHVEDGRPGGATATARQLAEAVLVNVSHAIKGKDSEIRHCLITLLCQGHLLIEDVPGVGKTMLAKALARSLDCTFRRIQFTPDLLPTDVTGVRAYNQKMGEFEFHSGPVFAQILLADEINRATPKTQSALLEAMEERQVTIDGQTHELPRPFLVMATQNPVDYAGTFPLPEAQLDRFLMRVRLGYLSARQEADLLGDQKVESPFEQLLPVIDPAALMEAQQAVRHVYARPELRMYIARLVERTRQHPDIALGASTRGTLNLFHAAQARAALAGREYVTPDDVKDLIVPVLAHRLILHPRAEAQSRGPDQVLAGIMAEENVPQLAFDS